MKNLEKIIIGGRLYALIIRAGFKKNGIEFFTPPDYSQQLAYMRRPRGHVITSHIHKQVLRKTSYAQEVLLIKKGKIRIDFYDGRKHYIESRIVRRGDVVLLAFGGHGFKIMEDAEMVEVKQGPFLKDVQPVRFKAVSEDKIKLKK